MDEGKSKQREARRMMDPTTREEKVRATGDKEREEGRAVQKTTEAAREETGGGTDSAQQRHSWGRRGSAWSRRARAQRQQREGHSEHGRGRRKMDNEDQR